VRMDTGVEFYTKDAFGADGQLADDPDWTMYVLKGHESAEKSMFHVEAKSRAMMRGTVLGIGTTNAAANEGFAESFEVRGELEKLYEECPDVKELVKFLASGSRVISESDYEKYVDEWVAHQLRHKSHTIKNIGDVEEAAVEGLKLFIVGGGSHHFLEDKEGTAEVSPHKGEGTWTLRKHTEHKGKYQIVSHNNQLLATAPGLGHANLTLIEDKGLEGLAADVGITHDVWSIAEEEDHFLIIAHNDAYLKEKDGTLSLHNDKDEKDHLWSFEE